MNDTLIFTATFNESENIKNLINQITSIDKDLCMLIIDDNSPDKTYEIVEELSKENKNIKLLKREKKLGLNTAHILAYDYAIKNNYNNLITMDADFSHDPKEIPKVVELLKDNDFVIGSRYIDGGSNDQKFTRYLLSFLGNKFIKLISRTNSSEFTTSYRGFNIKKLKNFHLNQINANGYSFFMETVIKINKKKFKCKEFPISFKDRKYGISKIPKIEIFRTLFNLFKITFKNEK